MSLTGPALKWFTKLPVRSISSFAQLQEQFTQQFSSSRRIQKTSADLYRMHMYRGKPLAVGLPVSIQRGSL